MIWARHLLEPSSSCMPVPITPPAWTPLKSSGLRCLGRPLLCRPGLRDLLFPELQQELRAVQRACGQLEHRGQRPFCDGQLPSTDHTHSQGNVFQPTFPRGENCPDCAGGPRPLPGVEGLYRDHVSEDQRHEGWSEATLGSPWNTWRLEPYYVPNWNVLVCGLDQRSVRVASEGKVPLPAEVLPDLDVRRPPRQHRLCGQGHQRGRC